MNKIETTIYSHDVTITSNNIHITKSYTVKDRKTMNNFLNILREYLEDSNITMKTPFNFRSNNSLIREWVTHNNLYRLGLYKDRVKDIDLNYPQKWYIKILYAVGSIINLNK